MLVRSAAVRSGDERIVHDLWQPCSQNDMAFTGHEEGGGMVTKSLHLVEHVLVLIFDQVLRGPRDVNKEAVYF
jgi:hypothetical protein